MTPLLAELVGGSLSGCAAILLHHCWLHRQNATVDRVERIRTRPRHPSARAPVRPAIAPAGRRRPWLALVAETPPSDDNGWADILAQIPGHASTWRAGQ